jgi:ABC-type nitrate/sulfonate/bicarbonate transport system permease component
MLESIPALAVAPMVVSWVEHVELSKRQPCE